MTDIKKMIKVKKERLSKTTYYDSIVKLKEFYVKMCKNLCCYASILLTVKEIVSIPSADECSTILSIKKVKRLLAIKSNKISIVDYKTKKLIRTQRISDLKSWCSGDGTCMSSNYGPVYLLNNQNNAEKINNNVCSNSYKNKK
jgi:hypothetical protein